MPRPTRIAAERRHTLFFLRYARRAAPVFLDTEVDMTQVQDHRDASRRAGHRYSFVTYVLLAAGRVLAGHPDCNASVGGGLVPRLLRHREVRPKVSMDRTVSGRRVTLAAVLPDVRGADLDGVQSTLDRCLATAPEDLPEFRGALALQQLPARLGYLAFRAAVSRMASRPAVLGTIAVSSLGHRPVYGFHAVGGTVITLNLGQVRPMPVVRDGGVVVAPMLRVTLAFDHRAVDGAEAADVLTELRHDLEAGRGLEPPVEPTSSTMTARMTP